MVSLDLDISLLPWGLLYLISVRSSHFDFSVSKSSSLLFLAYYFLYFVMELHVLLDKLNPKLASFYLSYLSSWSYCKILFFKAYEGGVPNFFNWYILVRYLQSMRNFCIFCGTLISLFLIAG